MDFSVPPFVIYMGSWFATMGGVWTLFERAEKAINEETRQRIKEWLDSSRAERGRSLEFFANLSDRIFGEHLTSLRSFLISSSISFFTIACLFAILFSAFPDDWERVKAVGWTGIGGFFLVGGFLNLIPDYVSMVQTRALLRPMSKTRKKSIVVLFTFLDVALTFLIISIAVMCYQLIYGGPGVYRFLSWTLMWDTTGLAHFYSPYIYSTLSTSFWLWLYIAAAGVIRSNRMISRGRSRMATLLDTSQPLRAMGFVSILFVTVAFAVYPIVKLVT